MLDPFVRALKLQRTLCIPSKVIALLKAFSISVKNFDEVSPSLLHGSITRGNDNKREIIRIVNLGHGVVYFLSIDLCPLELSSGLVLTTGSKNPGIQGFQ